MLSGNVFLLPPCDCADDLGFQSKKGKQPSCAVHLHAIMLVLKEPFVRVRSIASLWSEPMAAAMPLRCSALRCFALLLLYDCL